jgi:hypothetical protein
MPVISYSTSAEDFRKEIDDYLRHEVAAAYNRLVADRRAYEQRKSASGIKQVDIARADSAFNTLCQVRDFVRDIQILDPSPAN